MRSFREPTVSEIASARGGVIGAPHGGPHYKPPPYLWRIITSDLRPCARREPRHPATEVPSCLTEEMTG
jgi:hypothetical protein